MKKVLKERALKSQKRKKKCVSQEGVKVNVNHSSKIHTTHTHPPTHTHTHTVHGRISLHMPESSLLNSQSDLTEFSLFYSSHFQDYQNHSWRERIRKFTCVKVAAGKLHLEKARF